MAGLDGGTISARRVPDAAPGPNFRYWAFISYSHRDETFAVWLHRALETYRIPTALVGRTIDGVRVPNRLVPIFRDRDELPSAADLGAKVRGALAASHALVVICSPAAAASRWVNEEIRTFKALGHGERIIPVIIDGEPNASDRPGLGLPECFPPALRFAVGADGQITDHRVDPAAADAREGKDGRRNALLKVMAGILGVGFDDLQRRDERRQRKRRLLASVSGLVGLLLVAAAYVGAADAGSAVPGGDLLRRQLDRLGVTVFRPVPSRQAMAAAADATRRAIRARMVAALPLRDGPQSGPPSVWEMGQVAAALYRDPGASSDELRALAPMIERHRREFAIHADAAREGTNDPERARAEPVLWMLLALSAGLSRPGVLGEAERDSFRSYLELVQEVAEALGPGNAGGWNAVFRSGKPGDHSTYVSALALHALLDVKEAGTCWKGDCVRLTQMIADTSRWLVQTYSEDGGGGWRRAVEDDLLPDPNLTGLVLSALGRSALEAGTSLPAPILRAGIDWLIGLAHREDVENLVRDFESISWVELADQSGRRIERRPLATRILWYPWAVMALTSWTRIAVRQDFAAEDRRRLERSLGHLLVTLAPKILSSVLKTPNWVCAETHFGLGRAPGVRSPLLSAD